MAISNPPKGNSDKVIGANFAPLSVTAQPSPNMSVAVRAGGYFTATGEFKEFNGGNATIAAPTGNEWALIYLTPAGILGVKQQATLAAVAQDELPLAAVFVGSGVTTITNDKVYDARPLFVSQAENVPGGINADLALRPTTVSMNNALDLKADVTGTAQTIFEVGAGSSAIDVDIKAGAGTLRFSNTSNVWELDNGSGFNPIGTTVAAFSTITGIPSDSAAMQAALDLKSDDGHTHLESQISNLKPYLLNLNDVSIQTLGDVSSTASALLNQVLMWNNTEWVPTNLPDHTTAIWGNITGTLSAQADLQTALDLKTTKLVNPIAGNLVSVDANGVLLDSGAKSADFEPADSAIQAHIAAGGNPHATDLADLASVVLGGLTSGEVLSWDGTNWVNQAAGGGAPITSVFGRTGAVVAVSGDYSAADVGLGNVDNTTDLLKPISTATQSALNLKSDATHTHVVANITDYVTATDAAADARIALAVIDNLADVVSAGAVSGQILKHDGTNWVLAADVGITDHTALTNIGTNTHAQIDTHIADATLHYTINDVGTTGTDLFSASKIIADLAGKANTVSGAAGNVATLDGAGNLADSGVLGTALAPIDAPTFTTSANAPTPSGGDDTTAIATTAFVQAEVGTATQTALNLKADLVKTVRVITASAALASGDAGNHIELTPVPATPSVITIDPFGTTPLTVGATVVIEQVSDGTANDSPTTIVGGAGVSINGVTAGLGATIVAGSYKVITLFQKATDVWVAYGDVA